MDRQFIYFSVYAFIVLFKDVLNPNKAGYATCCISFFFFLH